MAIRTLETHGVVVGSAATGVDEIMNISSVRLLVRCGPAVRPPSTVNSPAALRVDTSKSARQVRLTAGRGLVGEVCSPRRER
jgi:hypothetical protein